MTAQGHRDRFAFMYIYTMGGSIHTMLDGWQSEPTSKLDIIGSAAQIRISEHWIYGNRP
jgi:hypothetical protein